MKKKLKQAKLTGSRGNTESKQEKHPQKTQKLQEKHVSTPWETVGNV